MIRVLAVFSGVILAAFPALTGCRTQAPGASHRVATARDGHPMHCRLCYDEAVRVSTEFAKGSQWRDQAVIRRHRCEGCRHEVTVYVEGDKPMIRCPGCAPEGVACDRCLPPRT